MAIEKLEYNYKHAHPDYYRDYILGKFEGPKIGEKAPDFYALNTAGKNIRLSDFRGKLIVLETGSITCPLTLGNMAGMHKLMDKYPHVVFILLYVREAHPGNKRPAHRSIEDKMICAKRLKKEEKEKRIVMVDTIDGKIHKRFGSLPNEVYVIDKKGIVAYRAQNNNPREVKKVLEALSNGENKKFSASYEIPAMPPFKYFMQAARRAGWRAIFDAFIILPKAIVILLKRKFILITKDINN